MKKDIGAWEAKTGQIFTYNGESLEIKEIDRSCRNPITRLNTLIKITAIDKDGKEQVLTFDPYESLNT